MARKKVHPEKDKEKEKTKEDKKGKTEKGEAKGGKEEKKKEKKPKKEKKKPDAQDGGDEEEDDDEEDEEDPRAKIVPKNYTIPKELKVLEKTHLIIIQHELTIYQVDYGFATNNRYHIFDNFGNKIYDAAENGKIVCACNDGYDFNLNVYDKDTPVMTCNVPYNFWHSCFGKSKGNDDMEIKSGDGAIIGYVHQENYNPPKFRIEDNDKDTVFYIVGPKVEGRLSWRLIGEGEFSILTADESMKIGKIARIDDDILGDEVENGENFGVEWPEEVNAGDKATMIGAVFLIDYMYFERTHNKKQAKSDGVKKGKYGHEKILIEVGTGGSAPTKEEPKEESEEKDDKGKKEKGAKGKRKASRMSVKSAKGAKKGEGAPKGKKKPDDFRGLDGGGGSDFLYLVNIDFAIGSLFFFGFSFLVILLIIGITVLHSMAFK